MSGKFTILLVALIVTTAAPAAHARVIADVERLYPNAVSSLASVRIAPGPLAEGAQAYVDRTHVCRNVPPALVGAEYVLLSNDDKYSPEHKLHITVEEAGTLFLIIDNRVGTHMKDEALSPNLEAAGMTWVAEMGFIDTGMKMAVDESADGMIDNFYTVFSIPVSPGLVVLKAQNDVYMGGPHDRNMYIVAAVPSGKATNPVPADRGQAGLLPLLQWTPGVGAAFHNVYLSASRRFTSAHLVASYLLTPFYQVTEELTPGVTYYWRVDEVGADIVTGNVWSFTTKADEIADADLVGWWKLDDEGIDVASDSSMGGHDGILYGDPSWVPGHIGDALRFDGIDDYVDTYYYEDLPVWTVSAWVISPWAPRQGGVGGPVHREANYQFNWNHDDSSFIGSVALLIGDIWYPASFGPLLANQWYHLAATFDGSSLKAYVDGDLITTNTAAQGVPSYEPSSLKIGRHAGGPWYFEGAVDDVRVYRRALTQEEIENLTHYAPWEAQDPHPSRGANMDIREVSALRWSPGQDAVMHDVYFGTDANVVETADVNSPVYWGRQADTNFPLQGLAESVGTYFWRVDEVEADGATIHKGPVWNFTVFSYPVIDDFESYTWNEGSRLSEVWVDGFINKTGSQMSLWGTSPAQPTGEHGRQSMGLAYNNARPPFVSEVERGFIPEQDWTANAGNALSLWLRGDVVSFGETSPGTFAMSAIGADIWRAGDQFRYAYQRLDGDGVIVAKVESVVNTDIWAKAGVMIRESLDPRSAHAFMLVTPDGLRAFQNRASSSSDICLSAHSWAEMRMPSWIMLERDGDQFTGYHSVDGVNWIRQSDTDHTEADASPNPQAIQMPPYIYVGLALTSHAAGAVTMATFSNVEIIGDVIGPWQVAEIGVTQPGNSPDDLYVVVEDSDGKTATVVDPDLAAVNTTAWTEWKIPLSDFIDVDLSRVSRMSIGVGGRETTIPPGTGRIRIDDIRVQGQ